MRKQRYQNCVAPEIGAGLGKLDWNSEVKPLFESILSDCETVFNVYEDYKIEYEI